MNWNQFEQACVAGDIKNLKFPPINAIKFNNQAKLLKCVLIACENGHFDIVERLVLTYNISGSKPIWIGLNHTGKPTSYNMIHAFPILRDAFAGACKDGHLKIAQLLYKRNMYDGHITKYSIFSMTCVRGHVAVAKWLLTVFKKPFFSFLRARIFHRLCAEYKITAARWVLDLFIENKMCMSKQQIIDAKVKLANFTSKICNEIIALPNVLNHLVVDYM